MYSREHGCVFQRKSACEFQHKLPPLPLDGTRGWMATCLDPDEGHPKIKHTPNKYSDAAVSREGGCACVRSTGCETPREWRMVRSYSSSGQLMSPAGHVFAPSPGPPTDRQDRSACTLRVCTLEADILCHNCGVLMIADWLAEHLWEQFHGCRHGRLVRQAPLCGTAP